MEVRVTTAAATHPLRHEILRPHQRLDEMAWPGDDHLEAIHLVASEAGRPVGMVSFFPLAREGSDAQKSFRLRGMGVIDARRGTGIGTAILERGVELVTEYGGDEVWCHAREGAVRFYQRHGFVTEGDFWDVPVIGPHVLMFRELRISAFPTRGVGV